MTTLPIVTKIPPQISLASTTSTILSKYMRQLKQLQKLTKQLLEIFDIDEESLAHVHDTILSKAVNNLLQLEHSTFIEEFSRKLKTFTIYITPILHNFSIQKLYTKYQREEKNYTRQ